MGRILVLVLAGIIGLSAFSPAPASAASHQGSSKTTKCSKHKGHHHKKHHHKK